MNSCRYLGYNVKQHVNFDATLIFPKVCPPEQGMAKANHLDPCLEFIVRHLQQSPDTPETIMHEKLQKQVTTVPKVDPKTVYIYGLREILMLT